MSRRARRCARRTRCNVCRRAHTAGTRPRRAFHRAPPRRARPRARRRAPRRGRARHAARLARRSASPADPRPCGPRADRAPLRALAPGPAEARGTARRLTHHRAATGRRRPCLVSMRIFLAMLFLAGVAHADTVDVNKMKTDDCARARKLNKTCVIDMGKGEEVEGGVKKPEGSGVGILQFGKAESLIRIRRDFIVEILKTAEDID